MLAINEINAAGGVLGKQIDLMTEDDQSKTEDAVASVQKLVNSDRVIAVLGEVASSRSMAGADLPDGACPDDYSCLDKRGRYEKRRLYFPRLFYRSFPRSGNGAVRDALAKKETRGDSDGR